MITKDGYSKSDEFPDGIVITFGKEMMQEQGGVKNFLKNFEKIMATEGTYWQHKCRNKPRFDISTVYIIVLNRVWCRVFYGGYETGESTGTTADGRDITTSWPRLILAGPLEKAPYKIHLPGFRSFRYATNLW